MYAMTLTVHGGVQRLFGYIQGHNEANVTIPMTVPVRVKITPGEVGSVLLASHTVADMRCLRVWQVMQTTEAHRCVHRVSSAKTPSKCHSTSRSGSGTRQRDPHHDAHLTCLPVSGSGWLHVGLRLLCTRLLNALLCRDDIPKPNDPKVRLHCCIFHRGRNSLLLPVSPAIIT
jgi:SOUL heme-binding protein